MSVRVSPVASQSLLLPGSRHCRCLVSHRRPRSQGFRASQGLCPLLVLVSCGFRKPWKQLSKGLEMTLEFQAAPAFSPHLPSPKQKATNE